MKLVFFPPSFTHFPVDSLHSTSFKNAAAKAPTKCWALALVFRSLLNVNANLGFCSSTPSVDWWLCCFRCVCERYDARWCSGTFSRHSQYLGHGAQLWWEQAGYIWWLDTRSEAADWYQVLEGHQKTVQTWAALQRKGKLKSACVADTGL